MRLFIDDQEIEHCEAEEPTANEAREFVNSLKTSFDDTATDRQNEREDPTAPFAEFIKWRKLRPVDTERR
jgi:hypothetical protein